MLFSEGAGWPSDLASFAGSATASGFGVSEAEGLDSGADASALEDSGDEVGSGL